VEPNEENEEEKEEVKRTKRINRILIKFGMYIIPLQATPNYYFLISYNK
jgi:hypothetical protein